MDLETATKENDIKYPEKDYLKKTFTFSAEELRELSSLDTLTKMGQMASMMSNGFVQNTAMQRVKVKNSQDVGLVYSFEKGEFYVWEPKLWCSLCQNRKAEFQYKEKIYCKSCIDILKTQEKAPVEKVETPVEKKKK